MTRVKICGLTREDDALHAVEAGADAIGLNFWTGTPRCVDVATARRIVDAIGARALTVGVFVDASADQIADIRERTGIVCVQLHGTEPPELVARFLPHAYKALRVRGEESIEEARRFPGEHILLDAYVAGQPGGTGHTFNWRLAAAFARERKVTLAGGLHPGNVAEAIAAVGPYCVDVASGVERSPGVKDPDAVSAFIRAARAASPTRPGSALQSSPASPIAERPSSTGKSS
jgi:phosphoribosylanthranilate isomerase